MTITEQEMIHSGYRIPAAPADAWRTYDETNPVPGYFKFDWLSSRHPDLYHQFALSSDGLIQKLHTLIDLSDSLVIDIGAGTGRSARGTAANARKVFALDFYESVVMFGNHQLQLTDIGNVHYLIGSRDELPFQESSADVVISSWAELNVQEAYRVLKPHGYLIQMGSIPTALCGELTAEVGADFAFVPKEYAPRDVYQPEYPETHRTVDNTLWGGLPVTSPIDIHEFTYIADYPDYMETASIAGRLYGPKAKDYFMTRKQSTFSWRLQIIIGQVKK